MKFIIFFVLFIGAVSAWKSGKVFNGQQATSQSQFSYMASVKNTLGNIICGGAIINTRWVLSAAHCNLPSIYYIGVGNLNLNFQTNYMVQFTVPYPSFFNETRLGDILLIKTKTAITMIANQVSAITLNTNMNNDLTLSSYFTIAGWGLSQAPSSTQLMYAQYANQDQSYCWTKSTSGDVIIPYSPEVNICAMGSQSTPAYPVTICSGDTGGPLVLNNIVYGIASRLMTTTCPGNVNLPDVFTRVAYYNTWINGVINGFIG